MKAYLINPEAREVTEVDVREREGDIDLAHAYELMHCADIEGVRPLNARTDMLLLDEHGKFRPNDYWICRLYPYEALAGRALWVGCDREGVTKPPKMPLEYVIGHVAWGPL
jgi:hypothetical protein